MLKGPPKMRNYDRATATNAEMLAITSAIVALVFALRAALATTHAASLASAAIEICSRINERVAPCSISSHL
jgi:hypothetical protein